MAKKAEAADDVPGIYQKSKPIPLKIGSAESKAALRALDNRQPWVEWFGGLGIGLQEQAASDNSDAAADSRYALHLWTWCRETVSTDPSAAKVIRNAMELGKLLERIQIRPYEQLVRQTRQNNVNQSIRAKKKELLSESEWEFVKEYIAIRVKAKVSASTACKEAAAQLVTGKFRRITRRVKIASRTLENRWSKRN